MVLADFGVAFVIVTALAVAAAVIARDRYRRRHPPLTTAEKTAQLESELAEVNREIRKIEEADTWDT